MVGVVPPRQRAQWWWVVLVVAAAAVGRGSAAGLLAATAAAVATLGALVGAGHQLRTPWLVGAVTAAAVFVLAAPPSAPTRVPIALLTGGLAALAAGLGARPAIDRVTVADGFYGVGLMILLSGVFTAVVPLPSPTLSTAHLTTLLVLYLITPPLEAITVLLVLAHAPKFTRFVAANYAWRSTSWREIGQGVTVGVAIILLSSLLIQVESVWFRLPVHPNNPFVYDPHAAHAPVLGIAALALAVVVLAPLAEEALFRGLLFGGMAARWGFWPAALLSAAIFGGAHLNLSLWLPLSVAGLLLALVYFRTRSLWSSTAAHATLNGVSVLLALLVR